MSEIITLAKAFKCPHCRKLYQVEYWAIRHEALCWQNPNRTPRDGELTHSGQWECQRIMDREGNLEPMEDSPWHPGVPGQCWFDGAWHIVPGFYVKDPETPDERGDRKLCDMWPTVHYPGGFGASWDYPGDPDMDVPLNEVERDERVRWLKDQQAQTPIPGLQEASIG